MGLGPKRFRSVASAAVCFVSVLGTLFAELFEMLFWSSISPAFRLITNLSMILKGRFYCQFNFQFRCLLISVHTDAFIVHIPCIDNHAKLRCADYWGKKTYIGKRLGDKATNCTSLLRIHTAFSLQDFYFRFVLRKHGWKMGLARKIKSQIFQLAFCEMGSHFASMRVLNLNPELIWFCTVCHYVCEL